MLDMLVNLARDETGVTMIDYAFVISLVSIACLAAFQYLSASVTGLFGVIEQEVTHCTVLDAACGK